MNIKKIVSAVTAFALSATMFAGFSVQAATAQPATVTATSSANIVNNAITATTSDTTSLYIHYYSKNLSEAMVAFDLGEDSYDADHILKAELSTYNWTTSSNTGRTLNGSLYALADTDLSTTTTTGDALWSTTGKISAYLSAKTVDAAELKTIDVTDYMQSLAEGTSAVAFKYTVDTSSICDWNMATQFTTGKEPTLALTYGNKVDFVVTRDTVAEAEAVITINEQTYTTDENGKVSVVLPAGSYDYSIEKSANYEAATGTVDLTAGDATENVALTTVTAQPATITVKYVDAADTTKELKASTTVTEEIYQNMEYVATEEQKASFSYTENEIVYTATLNSESETTVTPTSETAELVLKFDLTEKTYAATITTAPYAQVVITGTSKSGETVNTTVYSDNNGTATANLLASGDAYAVAVTKSGYTANNGTVAVSTTGGAATVALTATDSSVVYYEDFTTTGMTSGAGGLYGMADSKNAYIRYNEKNGVRGAYVTNGGSGARSLEFGLGSFSSDFDIFELTTTLSHEILNSRSGDATITFKSDSTVLSTMVVTFTEGAVTAITVNGEALTDLTATSLKITVNTVTDEVTTQVGDESFVLEVADAAAPNKISVAMPRDGREYFSNYIKITGSEAPVVTATTVKPEAIETAPTTAEAYEVTAGTKAETATEVDLTDVTTVYIKVDNVADAAAMPSIVVGEDTYAPTYKYEINANGYFVYQFVGIDVTGATVNYAGAASVTL